MILVLISYFNYVVKRFIATKYLFFDENRNRTILLKQDDLSPSNRIVQPFYA